MMVKYEVFNFGGTRSIPYKEHALHLQQNWGFVTEDKELVKVLKELPYITVREIEPKKTEGSCKINKDKGLIVYEKMNFFNLRKIAREMGIEVTNKECKNDILDKIKKYNINH
jgi:hypothetical protein